MAVYGFLGLGIMGTAMASRLVGAGFDVVIWNRTPEKAAPVVALGARQAATPRDVVASADITFAMLSTPAASLEVAFDPEGGALQGVGPGHDYVEMSSVDDATTRAIGEAVVQHGGRFAEAPVAGSKKPAEDGQLLILAAGDESLIRAAQPVFDVLGKQTFVLGEVGNGVHMKLVVNAVMGDMLVALAEGVALGQKSGLDGRTILDVLDVSAMACPMFRTKGPVLLDGRYPTAFPLKHMQKDMRLAVALGEAVRQPMHCTAAANETFKRALADGHGDEDIAAVFEAVR